MPITRCLNALTARITSALSPFGAGGINPYAYCAGDPVNHTDPSGHLSWQSILGIVASAIGLALAAFSAGSSIAAAGSITAAITTAPLATATGGLAVVADATGIAGIATENSNPTASAVLGWVSMGTGLAGLAAGIRQAPKAFKNARIKYDELRLKFGSEHMQSIIGKSEISMPKDLRFNSSEYYFNHSPSLLNHEIKSLGKINPRTANINNLEQFRTYLGKVNAQNHIPDLKFVVTKERKLLVGEFVTKSKMEYITHPAIIKSLGYDPSEGVLSAGRIKFFVNSRGMYTILVNNESGHFLPSDDSLNHFVAFMKSWGAERKLSSMYVF